MEMLSYESTSLTRDSTNPVASSAPPTLPRPTQRKRAAQTAGACVLATCHSEPSLPDPPGKQQHVTVPSVDCPPTHTHTLLTPLEAASAASISLFWGHVPTGGKVHARSHLIAN